jgi:glyoxylase-like metal-dependent hydrolase (beta-lactamase superfamily II)
MSYTGSVKAGGPVAVRELPGLTIAKQEVGWMGNNAYLLRDRATGDGMLIDAADEAERLAELVRLGGPPVRYVLTTHRHGDHWQALRAVAADTGAQTLAGTADADELPVAVDRRLDDGDTVELGASTLEIIGLRGHTPGSVAVLYRDPEGTAHLFTGDSLFPGGIGRTIAPEDFDQLFGDVTTRVFDMLPDDTWVYPGHGDDTTLGAERPHLAEWEARRW